MPKLAYLRYFLFAGNSPLPCDIPSAHSGIPLLHAGSPPAHAGNSPAHAGEFPLGNGEFPFMNGGFPIRDGGILVRSRGMFSAYKMGFVTSVFNRKSGGGFAAIITSTKPYSKSPQP